MRRFWRAIALATGLVALSAAISLLQIAIFHRAEETEFLLFQDLAFLPLEVLLVTLVVDSILARREKQAMLHKMNMVIGAFYSEVGTDLLKRLAPFDANAEEIRPQLLIREDWTPRRFDEAAAAARRHAAKFTLSNKEFAALRELLVAKRDFLLRLLENPNLLEHDDFTDALWAVFHLTDELCHRTDLKALTESDARHLAGDADRAYKHILAEWLAYMKHLRQDYKYLFSLAMRTNPFDPAARVEVR